MDPLQPHGDGHTPISLDEAIDLRLSYITTRAELNEAEQSSIATALANRRTPHVSELLDDKYLRDLHRAMFREVWNWAGKYRTRDVNIGIEPSAIAIEVRNLVANANVWIAQHVEPVDYAFCQRSTCASNTSAPFEQPIEEHSTNLFSLFKADLALFACLVHALYVHVEDTVRVVGDEVGGPRCKRYE